MTKTTIRIVHHTCPTWGTTNCGKSIFGMKHVKTSFRWTAVTCEHCLAERNGPVLSEFERWWDKFAKKRLYWQPRDMPTLCGIAKDAWNAAIYEAENACLLLAIPEGERAIHKLKA